VKFDPVRRNSRLAVLEVEEGDARNDGAGADTNNRAGRARLLPSLPRGFPENS
jgi:hypothetical protein